MIFCIWYPSGGFGNFIASILNGYGKNFCRPKRLPQVSSNGNFHNQDLVAPTYFHDRTYEFKNFDPDLNYAVLVDNGINNETNLFRQSFDNAIVIKVCYSDYTWPVIAKTMIVKAMNSDLETQITIDTHSWPTTEPWAVREKYFLFLRDHDLRSKWRHNCHDKILYVEDLIDYNNLKTKLPVDCDDFYDHWHTWWQANKMYFDPIITGKKILQGNFKHTNDLWSQAVLYYQIWCEYGIEVPHNNYSHWFENYEQIAIMLQQQGINC